jgi:hypothetical protein
MTVNTQDCKKSGSCRGRGRGRCGPGGGSGLTVNATRGEIKCLINFEILQYLMISIATFYYYYYMQKHYVVR